MNLKKIKEIAAGLDVGTVQAFVHATRLTVDALLAEGQAVAATQTPGKTDYQTAEHDHGAPAGGWIAPVELRHAATAMAEAVAAEKWVDGFVFAVRAMVAIGAI